MEKCKKSSEQPTQVTNNSANERPRVVIDGVPVQIPPPSNPYYPPTLPQTYPIMDPALQPTAPQLPFISEPPAVRPLGFSHLAYEEPSIAPAFALGLPPTYEEVTNSKPNSRRNSLEKKRNR